MNHLLATFKQKNSRIPIWLMRQAGRYMNEYMMVRNSVNNFLELCYDVDKATQVTMQPIEKFGLDAAILFSDILVLPDALNWPVEFQKNIGPVLKRFETEADLAILSSKLASKINNVYQILANLKAKLPINTSLIGFAGSPWTVISYMLEGRGKQDFSISKNFLYTKPQLAQKLFAVITEQTIEHLNNQIKAGADVIQLFDSWSGMLGEQEYLEYVIKPTQIIVKALKKQHPSTPIIGFPRGSGYKYEAYITQTGIDGVSVDQFTPIAQMQQWQQKLVVQGNLDPVVLFAEKSKIKQHVDQIMHHMGQKNFIFNLGHGIMPKTPVENVRYLVDYVQNFHK